MATKYTNNFEGPNNGATLTTANTGGLSGNAFDVVTIENGSSTCVADTTVVHMGAQVAKLSNIANTAVYFTWNNANVAVATSATVYGKFYIHFNNANPASNITLLKALNGATNGFRIQVTTARIIRILDSGGTVRATASTALNINGWSRVEFKITPATSTTGVGEIKTYNTAESGTATETLTATNFDFGTQITDWQIGIASQPANVCTLYLDDLAVQSGASGYLGAGWTPVKKQFADASITKLSHNNFESGTNSSTITTGNSASPDAFDTVSTTGSGTAIFDNSKSSYSGGAAALSAKFTTTGVSDSANVQYSVAGTLTKYVRFNLYLTANPSGETNICKLIGASLAVPLYVALTSAGKLKIKTGGTSSASTAATALPLNQWVRVEAKAFSNSTTGVGELKYWTTPSSTGSTTETLTIGDDTMNSVDMSLVIFGIMDAASGTHSLWMDNVGISHIGYMGPGFAYHNADSLIVKRTIPTHNVDAIVVTRSIKTHNVDSLLLLTSTKTHQADSVLKNTFTKTHQVDADLKNTFTKTHQVDSVLRNTFTKTHQTDAYLYKIITLTHLVDSVLKQTQTLTHGVDAKVQNIVFKTYGIDALLQKTTILMHQIDADLLKNQSLSHQTDAVLKNNFIKTHQTDAVLKNNFIKTHLVDSVLKKAQVITYQVDAQLLIHGVLSYTTNGVLRNTFVKSHQIDGVLMKSTTMTHQTDATLKLVPIKTYQIDSILKKTRTLTHQSDAVLNLSGSKIYQVNAILLKNSAKIHFIDAVIVQRVDVDWTTSISDIGIKTEISDYGLRASYWDNTVILL